MLKPDLYAQRRTRLLNKMQQGIAILPNATEKRRNGDADYPYRFDSSFHYLCGFSEPESVLLLIAGNAPLSILFCREKDREAEIWTGYRFGPEAAQEDFGFDAAYPLSQLDEKLTELMGNQTTVFYPLGACPEWDQRLLKRRAAVQAQSRSGISAPNELRDIRTLINEMRLFKDAHELSILRRAAAISTAAHKRAMCYTQVGHIEYEIEAELQHEFCRHGARNPAYPAIVAGGANACVLHYIANNAQLHDGDLLLIDAGCELDGYASDITRTYPVNGRFLGAQKEVYEIVLASQTAAMAAAIPGNDFNAPHHAALQVLAQGFIDLKLCHGSVDEVLEKETYKPFYMHRTSHWMGMDVHDVGDYKVDNQWRTLQAGMVLTVEPGCYIRPHDKRPISLWNIGIRIEDDVVITQTGHEILSDAAPKTVTAIEELMRSS
ncbi:MAG: aminopeptidase P N-terminal domain-containing protein [Gallionella sp.]